MLYLLHGEDPFRIRLRANELVHALLSDEPAAKSDLPTRAFVPFGGTLGLTRLDARTDDASDILVAGQSQGLFAAQMRSASSWSSTPSRSGRPT